MGGVGHTSPSAPTSMASVYWITSPSISTIHGLIRVRLKVGARTGVGVGVRVRVGVRVGVGVGVRVRVGVRVGVGIRARVRARARARVRIRVTGPSGSARRPSPAARSFLRRPDLGRGS
jgi:hypothetical protein